MHIVLQRVPESGDLVSCSSLLVPPLVFVPPPFTPSPLSSSPVFLLFLPVPSSLPSLLFHPSLPVRFLLLTEVFSSHFFLLTPYAWFSFHPVKKSYISLLWLLLHLLLFFLLFPFFFVSPFFFWSLLFVIISFLLFSLSPFDLLFLPPLFSLPFMVSC